MKTKVTIAVLASLFFSMTGIAQKGIEDGSKYGKGEDSVRCLTNLNLYREYAKQDNLKDAIPFWSIVYAECPAASQYIYLDGESIIKWQLKNAKTEEDKNKYFNDLMTLYDNRIKYFGRDRYYPELYVIAKKGLDWAELKGNTVEDQKTAYDLLEKAIKGMGPAFRSRSAAINVLAQSVQQYISLNFSLYARNELPGETLIENYEYIQNFLDEFKKNNANMAEIVDKLKEATESRFASSGAADCNTLISMFGPKIEENKADKEFLTKTVTLMERAGCGESDAYYAASEYLHAIEPSSASAFGVAKLYLKREDVAKALEYYEEALGLEQENDRKADYLYQMSLIVFSKQKNYPKARELALRAIAIRPNWGAPYITIGQMYAQSAAAQELGSKDIENRAGYWAAVDKFRKAKQVDPSVATEADQQINIYQNYFPDKESIFFEEGFELDKPYKVGGWINETTICRPK